MRRSQAVPACRAEKRCYAVRAASAIMDFCPNSYTRIVRFKKLRCHWRASCCIVVALGIWSLSLGCPVTNRSEFCWLSPKAGQRRDFLLYASVAVAATLGGTDAAAFPNAVAKVKGPREPGYPPRDLGLLMRPSNSEDGEVLGLSPCPRGPNCFSTTYNPLLDTGVHGIEPWVFKNKSPSTAIKDILDVVSSYPPGQHRPKGVVGCCC
eukprot:TRINITY_DN119130_c0_g1_i1.p1 TRINITY_DN119130_c0_g1~~TRINITY_DN119130_c0_g1_i1.p1  ORF type:complete len:208 (+),score=16.76 TRINITY_DN119130_c0_g1_i1:54-677(+)